MILFDTDIMTLFRQGHPRIIQRLNRADEQFAITIVTRIEALQGRFASVLKAADGEQLLQALRRLLQTEQELESVDLVPLDEDAAAEFDRLRQNKKLKKIGRGDLLIASIALVNHATLVTRNVRDFQLVSGLRIENWAD